MNAELAEILRGSEALPVTRLVRGTGFAVGLVRAGRGIGRTLAGVMTDGRPLVGDNPTPSIASSGVMTITPAKGGPLWRAYLKLPEDDRKLLWIVAIEPRLSYAQVAKELGVPVGAIGPGRARALERLTRLLAEDTEGASPS